MQTLLTAKKITIILQQHYQGNPLIQKNILEIAIEFTSCLSVL